MKIKYIVIDNDGLELMFIFEGLVKHDAVSFPTSDIVSAGFVFPETGECYGKSIALDLDSRPTEDSKLARRLLGLEN